jgi:dUTP pyrophosphatase
MLSVVRLDPRAVLPTVAHPGEDLAYDLYALEDVYLKVDELHTVKTGIAARFQTLGNHSRFGLLIRDRSSLASKGITISGGVIDAGYTGEIKVLMRLQWPGMTRSSRPFHLSAGDKIAQMIPMQVFTAAPVVESENLLSDPGNSRGDKGFGSSGR